MIPRKVYGTFISAFVFLLFPIDISTHPSHHHANKYESSNGLPVFIAHRGDKFLIPEHTVPAYDVAMLTNVDFVEPDLVMTKDGVLVCHHDITLRSNTDVANHIEFAALMTQNRTLLLDGENVTIVDDWLISDFTYEQLSTLRVYQAKAGWRPQYFNGYYGIPTFQQYLDAVHKDTWRKQQKSNGNPFPIMGVIPELKNPDFHNDVAFHEEHYMEKQFMVTLRNNGYLENSCSFDGTEIPCSPLIVQCFHVDTIKYLSENTDLTLLTLVDTTNRRYLTYDGMRELQNQTTYVSMWKELLYTGIEQELAYKNITYDKEEIVRLGGFVEPQDLVEYAHSLGLKVGIYTIYHSEEASKRGCAVRCENVSKEEELTYYLDMGVDSFFVEGLSESLRIRDKWYAAKLAREGRASGGQTSIYGASWSWLMAIVGMIAFRH